MNSRHSIILFLIILLTSFELFSQKIRPVEESKGIEVNKTAPLFEATNQFGEPVALAEELKKGPVVLIFYRGEWCPVCTRYLSNLQDSLSYITDKGAQVLAVSPQKQPYLQKTAEKAKASFTLLYDRNYEIMDAYDVTFKPTDKEVNLYNTRLNAQLSESQSDDSQVLPVPATFIINQDGIIVWRQFNPDYKIRASVKEMLEQLP